MKDLTPFIGIPYSKLDCWGLVKFFYSEIFNIELNSYYDSPPKDSQKQNELISLNASDFIKTNSPQFGDIIVLRILGVPSHVGIYIDNNIFLHTNEKINSVIDKLSRWNSTIDSFYTVKR